MKRKVNLVGTGTLTISLPSSWIKRNNVKKGDEIEVIEKENSDLIVSLSGRKEEVKEASVNAEGLFTFIEKLIAAKYKAGYDRLSVKYSSSNELKKIQELLQETCIGFEIVEVSSDRIEIELISKPNIEEFEKILRKLWVSLELIANDLYDSIDSGNIEDVKSCVLRHSIINKYSDFCRRMLNKYPNKFVKVGSLYYQIENLEQIADLYRSIGNEIINRNLNLSTTMRNFLRDANEYYAELKSMNYAYSNEKMKKFIERKKKLSEEYNIDKISIKQKEIMVFVYLNTIVQRIYYFNSIIMTMQD